MPKYLVDKLDKIDTFIVDYSRLRVEGVPVKVNDMFITVDFVIFDASVETPLVLGKPCLAAIRAMINDQQKELVLRSDDKEDAHHEKEDKEDDHDKLLPNYDSQLENILDEFLKNNQVSFEQFEAQCKNLVEKAYDVERQLVEMVMLQHAVVEKEENFLEEETNGMKEPSKVRNVDLYGTLESRPTTIKEQDLHQKEQPSNKTEEKLEIDKVIDMICALFATVKLKRVWKQYPIFLKFMGFSNSSSHIRRPNSLMTSS
jgi:hypothetical protein